MSLLNESMTECVFMDKTTVSDGLGGVIHTWKDGARFVCVCVFNTSMEARIANKGGVTSLYTVTTPKDLTLEYHDVFRRLKDGKIFRVTSDGDDSYTPKTSNLNMRQVTAEEWSLPK